MILYICVGKVCFKHFIFNNTYVSFLLQRYNGGHAYHHFRATEHTFAMELQSQRVWDYTGDNYVHRLVQNKSDGKLVELGTPLGDSANDDKLDSINLEYTYLLTSQLDAQRLYFEEKIAFVENDAFQQIQAVIEKSKKTLEECEKYECLFSKSEKERKVLEKKNVQLSTRLAKLERELTDECQMNKSLRENQKIWQEKVTMLETSLKEAETRRTAEVTELQEQINDLMQHFATQSAIAEAPEKLKQEIQEGQMFVKENQTQPNTRKQRKKHK